MKILFGPGSNSLSHVMKCLSVMEHLASRGHEVIIAAGTKYEEFLTGTGFPCRVIPSIQERDDAGFPTLNWFRDPGHIRHCIEAEKALLSEICPDRVLGVFNFTLPISSAMARIPYDSLICGCMLRESGDVLGFHGTECDCGIQQMNLDTFFYYAAQKIKSAVGDHLPLSLSDARDLLRGQRTFLWDFPEFLPLPDLNGIFHVGPVQYSLPGIPPSPPDVSGSEKLAVISFGTCSGDGQILKRLTDICLDTGFRVFIAAGGHQDWLDLYRDRADVSSALFPDLEPLLDAADLFICHGGQLSVFQALRARVPILVMPFQPEQAHNGICLERMGCGRLLIPPLPFRVDSTVYLNALAAMSDKEIREQILALCHDDRVSHNLARAGSALTRYSGTDQIVSLLEEA